MASVSAYHDIAPNQRPADRGVYHDRDDCPEGRLIAREHREAGKADRRRCPECRKLDEPTLR